MWGTYSAMTCIAPIAGDETERKKEEKSTSAHRSYGKNDDSVNIKFSTRCTFWWYSRTILKLLTQLGSIFGV